MKNLLTMLAVVLMAGCSVFFGKSSSENKSANAKNNKNTDLKFYQNEIGADHLSAHHYEEGAQQKYFALNGNRIQIKKSTTISTAWAGHHLAPSENFIFFDAKALNGTPVKFELKITMLTWHGNDIAAKCSGRSETKYFDFKNQARENLREFVMPLTILPADLKCTQCGKMVNTATFLFQFKTLNDGILEISPFLLKTSFFTRVPGKEDEYSSHISNILTPGYTPYEMKKLPSRPRFADDVLTMSKKANSVQSQYASFRPILELLQKNDNKTAISEAEKIADNNIFCAIMLYLVYSRGYCDANIDYVKAAKYFSMFIGDPFSKQPGFRFWSYEYINIWKKYRLKPTVPGEKVVISAWSAASSVMDEVVPLRGKYPLINCYEERMRNLGGVAPRVLYLVAREQVALQKILEESRQLGNAEAWAGTFAPFDDRGMNPERTPLANESINKPTATEFKELTRSAELGYIPAKLRLARILVTKNFAPKGFDFASARKLLQESIAECEKYSATGCSHAETDLKYARELFALIPPENTPTAELVESLRQLQRNINNNAYYFYEFKSNIIRGMISARNDHPDCLFYQALELPQSQYKQKNQMIRDAAEKGSHYAINSCMQMFTGEQERWYFLYLAGKHKLPYNGSYKNYFEEAWLMLDRARFFMPHSGYIKALSFLAPYHSGAKKRYTAYTRELTFDISVSDAATVTAVKKSHDGRQFIEIKAQASKVPRYVVIKNKSTDKIRGAIMFHSTSPQLSNLDVSGEFKDENGRQWNTYCGNSIPMKFLPEELKVTIAPRQQPLDLRILFDLY